jgi:hypothetical protein
MELRSLMNGKPAVTISICVGLVIIGAIFVLRSGNVLKPKPKSVSVGHYYTADEGQTWEGDKFMLDPPFEKNGKTWIRVYVFTCGNGKPFAGYLEKYTPEALAQINGVEEAWMKTKTIDAMGNQGLLVKKLGSGDWVAKESVEGMDVIKVACPDGQPAKAVFPELEK